ELKKEVMHWIKAHRKMLVLFVLALYFILILAVIAGGLYLQENQTAKTNEEYRSLLIKTAEYICDQQSDTPQQSTFYKDPPAVVCNNAILIKVVE
ncbi:MAG: hypothetical protein QME12_09165, partial [Nanoarchaeota archaeon]|nr:hypothetical protein [Nanoarchaeota archaeon]